MSRPEKLDKASELAETIKTLSIDTNPPKVASRSPRRQSADSPIADSWEDDADDAAESRPTTTSSTDSRPRTADQPYAPPPTPSSPSVYHDREQYPRSLGNVPNRPVRSESPSVPGELEKRPEKSTAVASRLIAGALGVRAPKRTEEQRKYDRAIKEQEIRRKNKEKEDLKRKQEEAEKAKAAIWDD